jgi:tetratricopeptide (TPR) repeat protein
MVQNMPIAGAMAAAREREGCQKRRLDQGWLADQPETAIGCRITLGFMFLNSNLAESEKQFNAGLELARARGVDVIPELTAKLYEGLGIVSAQRNDYVASEKQFRQSIADFQRFKTPSSELGYVFRELARVLEMQSRPDLAAAARMDALGAFAKAKTADIDAKPGNPADYLVRARFLMRAGKFKEALPDLVRATDGNDLWAWYYLAPLQLQLGDETGYRATAAEMLKRFGNVPDPREQEQTAKVCALTPKVVGDIDQLERMTDFAMASHSPYIQWFPLAKGIVEFRAGHWEPAIGMLNRSIELLPSFAATAEYIIAMIRQRQGRPQDAREMFDRAGAQAAKMPKPGVEPLRDGPENYFVLDAFRREAEKTLNQK